MKNNKKILIICLISMIVIGLVIFVIISQENKVNAQDKIKNSEKIISSGTYQIKFSDLVSLEDLKEYDNKEVTAVGYLSPIMSYDGSFGYLMNLPYQTCPYCMPSDTKITNTISIFAKSGQKIEFTEAAVLVRGTLKLEPYTDAYGYSYNYRLVDVKIEKADTSELGEKIALYNKLAEKEILTNLMAMLYAVDDNVFYDEYTANGVTYERQVVDTSKIDAILTNLEDFKEEDISILKEVAKELKNIATDTNELIQKENYEKVLEYKERTLNLFYRIGEWMRLYQL
jgi:hypothetical protein